jgi:hypothetical protein
VTRKPLPAVMHRHSHSHALCLYLVYGAWLPPRLAEWSSARRAARIGVGVGLWSVWEFELYNTAYTEFNILSLARLCITYMLYIDIALGELSRPPSPACCKLQDHKRGTGRCREMKIDMSERAAHREEAAGSEARHGQEQGSRSRRVPAGRASKKSKKRPPHIDHITPPYIHTITIATKQR